MEELTVPTTYLLHGNKVEIMPYFLYEVSIYKITKNMASLIGSQFYRADKLLNIKNDITVEKFKNYNIVRYINILGVPKEFVEENNLPMYETKKKSKKKKNERTR